MTMDTQTKITRGTMVRIDGYGIGIMVRYESDWGCKILLDRTFIECVEDEVNILQGRALKNLKPPMCHSLPYGIWTCADGREILFNRDYKPIWSRMNGRNCYSPLSERMDRLEWAGVVLH